MGEQTMSLRAVGPAAEGRLALTEVARLCGELQATLERLALAIRGERNAPGRRPRDVADAVKLEMVAFRMGSAVLDMAQPADGMISHALLDESVDLLFRGMSDLARGDKAPSEFTPQVLDGLIRLSGGISSRSIRTLELSQKGRDPVVIDQDFREHVRRLRRHHRHEIATVTGRLHEGDFDPLALRCRIDTLDATIPCSFGQELRDLVLGAMDSMVVCTGIAEYQPDGRIRAIELDELTVIDEAQRRTIDQLAQEQGTAPVTDIAEFATMTDLSDDEFNQFIANAMSARS